MTEDNTTKDDLLTDQEDLEETGASQEISEDNAEEVSDADTKSEDSSVAVSDDEEDPDQGKKSFGKILEEDRERDTHKQWYVVHTYSGYEDQVADAMKHRIETLDMKDKIFDVVVPKEKQIEIRAGKRKKIDKKIFPGYILVNMIMTKNSWYVVRNTPNVTGFIGTGSDPVPINEDEVEIILKRMGVEEPKYKIDLEENDPIRITDGPFKEMEGLVKEVDQEKGKIKALVTIFGRETPVELDFLQVQKI